ncbi:MAG: hypothetical protein Q9184_007259, partial [Pyrenodesmia sp. 2 TL-2023]
TFIKECQLLKLKAKMLLLLSLFFMALLTFGKAHTIQLKQPQAIAPLPDNNNNNTQASILKARVPLVSACNALSNDFHIPLENGAKLTSFAPLHDNAKKLCSDMCNSGKGGYWFEAKQDFWTPSGNGPTVHQRIYCSTRDVAKTVLRYIRQDEIASVCCFLFLCQTQRATSEQYLSFNWYLQASSNPMLLMAVNKMFLLISILLLAVGNVLCVASVEPVVNGSSSQIHTQPSAISPRAPAVSQYGSAAICYSDQTKAPSISLVKHATAVVDFKDLLRDATTLCSDKCKQSRSSVMLAKYKDFKVTYFGEPKAKTRIYCQARYSEQMNGRPLDKKKCNENFNHIFAWCKLWSSMGNGAADGIQAGALEGNTSIEVSSIRSGPSRCRSDYGSSRTTQERPWPQGIADPLLKMLLSISACLMIGFLAIANALYTKPDLSVVVDSHSGNSTQTSILARRSEIKCNTRSNPLQIQFEKYGTHLEDFKRKPSADAVKVCGAICIPEDTVDNPINVHRKNLKHKQNIDKPERDDPSKYHRRLYCEADKSSYKSRFNHKTCKDTIARLDGSCTYLSYSTKLHEEANSGPYVGGGYGGEVTESGVTYRVYAVGISNGWSSSQNPGKGHKRSRILLNQTTAVTHITNQDVETSTLSPRADANLAEWRCNNFSSAPPIATFSGEYSSQTLVSNFYPKDAEKLCDAMCNKSKHYEGFRRGDFRAGWKPNRDHKRLYCTANYATPQIVDFPFDKIACKNYTKMLRENCGTFGGQLVGDKTWKKNVVDQGPVPIQYDLWAVVLSTGEKRSGVVDETTAIASPKRRDISPSMLSPHASHFDRPGSSCSNMSSPVPDPPTQETVSNFDKEDAKRLRKEMRNKSTSYERIWRGNFHMSSKGKDHKRAFCTAKYATSQTDSKFDKGQCNMFVDVLIDKCNTFGGRIFGSDMGYLDGQPIESSAQIQYDVWAVSLNE